MTGLKPALPFSCQRAISEPDKLGIKIEGDAKDGAIRPRATNAARVCSVDVNRAALINDGGIDGVRHRGKKVTEDRALLLAMPAPLVPVMVVNVYSQ